MHPFGGTPICPRCSKAVYAAEQIMGPGRKLYHKPCLACNTCGKRLDSLSLVEHDQEPYCKICHVKNFGTRDLRQANLPHRDSISSSSPPSSPSRADTFTSHRAASPPARTGPAPNPPPLPVRRQMTGAPFPRAALASPAPVLRPTRTLSPTRPTFSPSPTLPEGEEDEQPHANGTPTPSHTGRVGGLPRTVPLTPSSTHANPAPVTSPSSAHAPAVATMTMTLPLQPRATGTRYGAALGGPLAPTPTGRAQWGGGTPRCGRCGKAVYFAEQVKAVGATWHKACLRCSECGTTLDSGRLTEKDGAPFCHRCYGKLHGPQGAGYALLGKPGG
ncbi:LIM-domain-containing protein [Obba rivulosa]|uniref:LIM-domain-containing protein n=1 Tax=Obba rivulosa TaxID=1052685 RepID=A0A8E2B013_9APHY|nr:LIM-domain-containing protein [Obba rivulosa]